MGRHGAHNAMTNEAVDAALVGKKAMKGTITKPRDKRTSRRSGQYTRWLPPDGKPPKGPPAPEDAERIAERERRRIERRKRKKARGEK